MARPKRHSDLRDTLPIEADLSSLSGPRSGASFISDYITRNQVRATPEEVGSVQVFARRLVEDYRYAKTQIQIHPQYRVRIRPSDEEKSYPVDIAVFNSAKKTEGELFMVVECKKKDRKDGEHQLRLSIRKNYWRTGRLRKTRRP